jgi:phosphoribosylformylglycinamidine cyclo-ligase
MKKITYREAGVDIDAGEALVEKIKPAVNATMRPEVQGGIGGFSSMVALPKGLKNPLLVSGADGVGTKLKIAFAANRHETVGIDLVAMCVNDVLVTGAEPLFFLDYYACSKLDPDEAATVISGIAEGCREAGCALVGGETAELPGFYTQGEYDLAGFVVGVVDRDNVITGETVGVGDAVIGLPSSGIHSNGYSLVRAIVERSGLGLDDLLPGAQSSLGEVLLTPTRIYAKAIKALTGAVTVKSLAHITGGGLVENMPRTLPDWLAVHLNAEWPTPPVFQWLAKTGPVDKKEMYRTFNMGIGMTAVVDDADVAAALEALSTSGIAAAKIGEIVEHQEGKARVTLMGDD